MNPKNDTGPANGTFIFSLPPRRALSGLSKDRKQNAAVPRNVSPMRVTCMAVSSRALPMRSGESLRRPSRRLVERGLIDGSPTILPMAVNPWVVAALAGRSSDYSLYNAKNTLSSQRHLLVEIFLRWIFGAFGAATEQSSRSRGRPCWRTGWGQTRSCAPCRLNVRFARNRTRPDDLRTIRRCPADRGVCACYI